MTSRVEARKDFFAGLFFTALGLLGLAGAASCGALLHGIDAGSHGGIAGDVHRGAHHVQDAVDAGYESHALYRQAHRLQHHGQHDHAGPGHAGGADGGEHGGHHDGQLLADRKVDAEHLGDEDGADALVDGGAVHVDGGAERQHERGDLLRYAHFLGAFHVDGQRAH